MQNNNFTFEDIEPNINLDTIFYIPQDSVLSADTLTAVVDSPFVISSKIGGTVNHYQWYKNGDSIAGATDSILYFPTVAWSDSGFYTCRITNDIVTDLTLWRHTVTLWVTDTLTGVRPKPQDQSPKSQDLSPKFQIPIWPNPAKRGETITITCQSYNSAGAEATVYNILCTKVYKTTAPAGKGKITINTDNLQAGVYTVVLKMADKTGYGKVVVY
ncbi:MAG: T9SS type A sorting domain-containing protein [Bacteroidia bacterium]|nr:T9SS type A sorting domain-containing protein [Bacteroidia bacterium]